MTHSKGRTGPRMLKKHNAKSYKGKHSARAHELTTVSTKGINKNKGIKRIKRAKYDVKEIAAALIQNNGNKTKTMLTVNPKLEVSSAGVQADRTINDVRIGDEVTKSFKKHGLDIDAVASKFSQAIESGLGVKATNKDAIQGLKFVLDMYTLANRNNPEDELHRIRELESKDVNEIKQIAQEQSKKLDILLRNGAINGELEDNN